MQPTLPLACIFSLIRPPSIQYENAMFQIIPLNKEKCPYVFNDITFQLYTRHNPTAAHILMIDDDESLFSSSINFNDDTVFLFLAYMETPDDGSTLWLREAFMVQGNKNVIVVNSQRLMAGPWYIEAAHNTWYVGRITGMFIDFLVSRGLKLSETHLVGHSLGSQSAGVTGASIKSGLVAHITGLDAALPLFSSVPLEQRLDPSDAEFVDVIHTDAGIFGFNQLVGDVDFWPNGGTSPQPGCELSAVLPQQLLFNNCTNKTKSKGYCVLHLRENEPIETDIPSKINNRTIARAVNNERSINKVKKEKLDFDTMTQFPSENDKNSYNPIKILMKKSKKIDILKKTDIPKTKNRQRRFASFFNKEDNNLLKLLGFFVRNGKNIIPVISVIREINTLVKTSTGELNHMIKEQNNYIGSTATLPPVTYNIQFNDESKLMTFFKKIFGLGKGVSLVT